MVDVEIAVLVVGGDGSEALVGGEEPGEGHLQVHLLLDQRDVHENGRAGLVAVVGGQHDAVAKARGLGHGHGLQTGRDLDVGARPLELEVGQVRIHGGAGVGGGQVAVAPVVFLDEETEAELDGFVGHEVRAQAEPLPDLEAFLALPVGRVGGVLVAGEVAIGEEQAVDAGISGHLDLGGGQGRQGRQDQ